jgi:Gpi18-like mannosyltransferase
VSQFTGLLISRLDKVASHKYFVPICFIAALALRLAWIYFVPAQPVSDFRWYYERGIDFAVGHGYSVGPNAFWPENIPPRSLKPSEANLEGRSLTAYWPVGYPAFLGMLFWPFGPSLMIAKLANVVLSMGILFFSYYLAKNLFASELTGRITLLVLSFYPEQIVYCSLLASEILFLFLLLVGVAFLLAPWHKLWLAVPAGISFGLACLIKPQAILVPAVFFVVFLFTKMSRKAVREYLVLLVAVHLALSVTLLPWLIRNYRVFNRFVFISNNGGYNLLSPRLLSR